MGRRGHGEGALFDEEDRDRWVGLLELPPDLARLTVAAGLGRWSPNELRHSAASLLSASGVPLEQIADVLGHTDTRMLLKHYRHPISRAIDAAAAPMERLFGEQGGGA